MLTVKSMAHIVISNSHLEAALRASNPGALMYHTNLLEAALLPHCLCHLTIHTSQTLAARAIDIKVRLDDES